MLSPVVTVVARIKRLEIVLELGNADDCADCSSKDFNGFEDKELLQLKKEKRGVRGFKKNRELNGTEKNKVQNYLLRSNNSRS